LVLEEPQMTGTPFSSTLFSPDYYPTPEVVRQAITREASFDDVHASCQLLDVGLRAR
jgi:hypothetical protein